MKKILSKGVFLTSTDTAIGFVSQNAAKLNRIKKRPPHKRYIRALDSFRTLKLHTRTPARFKRRIRRSKQTTFLFANGRSFRVVSDTRHQRLLQQLGGWAYTTSANLSGCDYDQKWALSQADCTLFPLRKGDVSAILKVGKSTIRKLR